MQAIEKLTAEGGRGKNTPVVLWISRHEPLPSQIDALQEKLGDFKLIIHEKPLSTAEDAIKLAKDVKADYIIPVLPMTFIMHLVSEAKKHGFTVLRAEMQTLHNCETAPCPEYNPDTDTIMQSKDLTSGQTIFRHFRFDRFVVLKDIKIVTEEWV